MDFLLECIGFPPGQDLGRLASAATGRGERVAWRGAKGSRGDHLRLPLGSGLELRMDREDARGNWTLLPYFEASRRLRVAVRSLRTPPDSPDDVLMVGRANPAPRSDPGAATPDAYDLAAVLTDARRLPRNPREIEAGHVLAVALAGFALDVSHVGPRPSSASSGPCATAPASDGRARGVIAPLGGAESPGGCVEVTLAVIGVSEIENPLTSTPVQLLEVDAPGRSLPFFLSPWQLESESLPPPSRDGGSRVRSS